MIIDDPRLKALYPILTDEDKKKIIEDRNKRSNLYKARHKDSILIKETSRRRIKKQKTFNWHVEELIRVNPRIMIRNSYKASELKKMDLVPDRNPEVQKGVIKATLTNQAEFSRRLSA